LYEKLRGFIRLSRPLNVFISFLSVFVAVLICGALQSLHKVWLACLTAAFLTAAANAVNDFYDLDIDRINRPKRPLPSGVISPSQALVFSGIFFILGTACGFLINWATFFTALVFSVLLILYSAKFKRMVLVGNIVVSLATAFAFIYGGLAVGSVRQAIFPAIFAFLLHFGREIIKDMEDMEGDRRNGAMTMPVRHGLKPAQLLATGLFIVLIMVTIAPYLLDLYGVWYLLIVALVDSILVIVIIEMWRDASRMNFGRLSAALKVDMLLGLLAIYAGRW
jgi:geranylgeranylglycerol-phosphate geranylgeranyltransferase